MTRRPLALALSIRLAPVAAVLAVGCTPAPQEQPSPVAPPPHAIAPSEPPTEDPAPPLAMAAPPPPKLPPAEGEAAYFIVDPMTLARLDAGGFAAIPTPETLWKLQLDREGTLYASGFDTIYQLDDGRLRPLTAPLDQGMRAFFVASTEDIWAAQSAALFHWNGSEWTHEPLGPVDALKQDFSVMAQPKDIVVDRDQRVWVSTERDIMVREGTVWRTLPRRALSGRPLELGLDSDGAARLELTSHAFVSLPVGAKGRARPIAAKNVAWLEGGGSKPWTVVWSQPSGRRKKYRVGRDIEGITPSPPVADEQGRLWVGTAAGVTVLAEDGTKTEWPMGTVPQLAGRFSALAVDRGGPAELPEAGPVQTGTARGRLLDDTGPVVGATVELCTHALAITIPPCARSRPRYETTSNAQGQFELRDLPIGVYAVTVNNGGAWRLVYREERFVVGEGEPSHFGDIDATRGAIARGR